jgi:hypothetical protein
MSVLGRFLAILMLLSLMGACGVRVVVKPPPEPVRTEQTDTWLKAVQAKAQDGDWLVLRGYHDTDDLVAAATNFPLSHAVVVDRTRGEIIEAVGAGVGTMTLRKRIHEAHRVVLVRPKWWTEERGKAAVKFARSKIGASYDFLGTVGAGHKERYYCTELAKDGYNDHIDRDEHFPTVLEPGHMMLYGTILFDSGARN